MKTFKYRHEYKYVIDAAQLAMVKSRAMAVMQPDSHVAASGRYAGAYNIRSVYFDDNENSCYIENENGTDPREKFRIRIYNHDGNRISLEWKYKHSLKCLKQSCPLTREQCDSFLRGGNIPDSCDQPALLRKFTALIRTRQLYPVVIVEYDRMPYIHSLGNVRVTLDCNLRASSQCEKFFDPQLAMRPILSNGMQIFEVKWDELLPDYIYQAMMLESLQWSSCSKFYLCRKYTAIEKPFKY